MLAKRIIPCLDGKDGSLVAEKAMAAAAPEAMSGTSGPI